MVGAFGKSLFGIDVVVAQPVEWARLVEDAKAAGGVDVGNAERTDYDIVFDEKAQVMFVNPRGAEEIMARLRAAVPEARG